MTSVNEFEELYRAETPFVWRSLRRLGVPESDVADAHQEVFLVVFRRFDSFEGRSKLKKWLFGIALRVAAARRRKAHVRREVPDDERVAAQPDEDAKSSAAEIAERNQALRRAEVVLQSLPIEQCAVFVLFELEGLEGREIADMLDIPVPTVHSRLRLARQAFREGVRGLSADLPSRPGPPNAASGAGERAGSHQLRGTP